MISLIKRYPLAAFFILAFSITWAGSLIYYFSTPQGDEALPPSGGDEALPPSGGDEALPPSGGDEALPPFLTLPAVILWYFGPCLAAIAVTQASGEKGSVRRLLGRFRIWQVGWRWYAVIVIYPLILHLLVVGIDRLTGGPPLRFFEAAGVPSGNEGLTLIGLALYQVLVRGIGEETGWRGFALPAMQSRWSALQASLLLGVLWALWHFHPANFTALFSGSGFWIFEFLNVTATAVICTWVYNNTRGSLLMAALFHMTLNVAEYVVPISFTDAEIARRLIQTGILWASVGLLALRYGAQLCQDKLSLAE